MGQNKDLLRVHLNETQASHGFTNKYAGRRDLTGGYAGMAMIPAIPSALIRS
jgi:hypothetical protein